MSYLLCTINDKKNTPTEGRFCGVYHVMGLTGIVGDTIRAHSLSFEEMFSKSKY